MDQATLIGLVLGLVGVFGGMVVKGAPISSLANPAAFMIIILGTFASLFHAFPMEEIKRLPALFSIIFKQQNLMDKAELIRLMTDLAQQARREGILSLEASIENIDDAFLKNGMKLVIDGQGEEFVKELLEAEIAAMEERHQANASIFTQGGTYAPTLGVLGAVIGLIAALQNMADVNKLAAAIAAAFIATLLGIFCGYVIWHPFANKLKRKSKEEVKLKTIILEGILSVQSGHSPIQIQEKLMIYLNSAERQAFEQNKGGG